MTEAGLIVILQGTLWRSFQSGRFLIGMSAKTFYSIGKRRMAQGTIKRLTDKGYGFIEIGDGKDIFFHLSNLDGCQFEELYEGQTVTFTEGQGRKGPQAENVKPA